MTSERLRRTDRVRRRPEFERAYEKGRRIRGRFMTLFVVANGAQASRLGVAASRKVGSSVGRNRAKRLAREIFRRHKVSAGLDIVVVPRREMLDAAFSSLEDDYRDALARYERDRHVPTPQPSRQGRARPSRRV